MAWGFSSRTSTADSSNNNGESTPLISSQSSHEVPITESREPLAPPPSSAPPPPPTTVTTTTATTEPFASINSAVTDDSQSQSALSRQSKNSKASVSSKYKHRKNVPDPTVEAVSAASSHIRNKIKKTIKKKFEGPRKKCLHVVLDIVRMLASLSSFMMLGMQAYPLFAGLEKKGDDGEFSFGLQVAVR